MIEVEIFAIGNEILSGRVVNTNATFLSKELDRKGFVVVQHTVLPDQGDILERALAEAMERVPIVIACGGLGPTCDDRTREVAAKLFNTECVYHEHIAKELMHRYGDALVSLENQATLPKGAIFFKNTIGTASGIMLCTKASRLILLPGVPREMELMFLNEVLPRLEADFSLEKRLFRKEIFLCGLSESSVDPLLREIEQRCPSIGIGIYPSLGVLTVRLTTLAIDEQEASSVLLPLVRSIETQFASHLFRSTTGHVEEAIQEEFLRQKLTLGLAESCTGGALAARLIGVPGASEYFMGSLVTYSYELKQKILGVKPETLEKYGAVSQETVVEMWQGIFPVLETDIGISVSGIAGPTGAVPGKPVGTVWAAIGRKGEEPYVQRFQGYGDRQTNIHTSVTKILGSLWRYLIKS